MRILSLASDVSALAPLQNETKQTDSIVNERAEPTSARTPSIAASSTVPTVVLDTDVVSDNMAARLCISFLGHVLFLKNQVPFPIVQLARMPTSDNTTRASKKRHELLNSFDTLASHLYTTFIALSTALALRGSPEKPETGTEAVPCHHHRKHGVARAFFAVALGPTVGTAKSRVIVGIDGLETKVWGLREGDIPEKVMQTRGVLEEDDNIVESSSDTDDEDEDKRSEDEESGGSSQEEGEDTSGSDDDDASPPLSRSPSPPLSSDSESLPSTSPPNAPSMPSLRRAEDPETVRAAERLLSRTLASACAEDDGQGLASEMAPTQIHVLLRAPRRFDHSSWIPRQNLCTSMDNYLAEFLVESGRTPASCNSPTKKRTKANKVQGVWVKSHGNNPRIEGSEKDLAEEDELIWWSWDGKLVGFTDW